jgi:phage-related protein
MVSCEGRGGGSLWFVEFYEREDGHVPVEHFLRDLDPKARAKVVREIELLREFGTELREPYSKFLRKGLFELKIRLSRRNYRIFYFFSAGRIIVLTNGFIKKTPKTPSEELERALFFKADYERRKGNACI